MSGSEETGRVLAAKSGTIFPHLDERQRRLLMGAEARALGHGGIRLVARAAGVREATVSLGVAELDSGAGQGTQARRRAQAGCCPGSGAASGAAGPGRAGRARRSDAAAAVDH
jgi:hypothetical protein